MTFVNLWPTTIKTSKIESAIDINSIVMAELIVSRSNEFKFDQNSVPWDVGAALPKLRNYMLENVDEYLEKTNIKDVQVSLSNSWVHTSLPMQGIPYHTHHNSELVGIYVVSSGVEGGLAITQPLYHNAQSEINTPMGVPNGPNSLVLLDPRGGKVTLEENSFKNFYEVNIEAGMFILFPSYLAYYVMPNVGKDPRVLIMCNFEVE